MTEDCLSSEFREVCFAVTGPAPEVTKGSVVLGPCVLVDGDGVGLGGGGASPAAWC